MIPNSEPLICAFGSLISVPTLSIAIIMTNSYSSHILFWFNICIAISSLCLSWTMFSDILVNVIHPNKRSTAFAFSIIISHLFGDAGSPYLVGLVSFVLAYLIIKFIQSYIRIPPNASVSILLAAIVI